MKRIVFIIFVLFLANGVLLSQTEPPDTSLGESSVSEFSGGKHRADVSLYSSFFMGMNARAQYYGNTASSSVFGTHLISTNPAGMARGKKSMVTVDMAPGFGADIMKFYRDLQMEMDVFIDNTIEDYYSGTKDDFRYPALEANVNQAGWLNQIGLIFYDEDWGSFGFSWHRPLYLDINYSSDGVWFVARDEKYDTFRYSEAILDEDDNVVVPEIIADVYRRVDFEMPISLFNNANVSMYQADFAYGRQYSDKFYVGGNINISSFALKSHLKSNTANAGVRGYIALVDSLVVPNADGTTQTFPAGYVFYDLKDDYKWDQFDGSKTEYNNSMANYGDVDFSGYFFGAMIAGTWVVSDKWTFDMSLETPRSDDLDGYLQIVQNKSQALNLSPGEGEEIFDISQLDPNRRDQTLWTQYDSKDMRLNMPGKFAFSVTWQPSDWRVILAYETYFSDITVDYKVLRREKGEIYIPEGQQGEGEEWGWQGPYDGFENYEKYLEYIANGGSPDDEEAKELQKYWKILKYKVGLKPKHGIKFAVGRENFAFSAQAFISDIVAKGITDAYGEPVKPAKNLIIPSIGLGTSLNITKNTTVDVSIFSVPAPIFRTSITYTF